MNIAVGEKITDTTPGHRTQRELRENENLGAMGRTKVPCTCNCKVNSERYLRQHVPQRVVFINPRYPESRLRNPELLAAPGAMHHRRHAEPDGPSVGV